VQAYARYGNSFWYFQRQAGAAVVGLIAATLA
jgi:hypothetical protein